MGTCGIYKITSSMFDIYIGQSKNIERRFREYRNGRTKNQKKLGDSFRKYGWQTHMFQIIHPCKSEELHELERHYVKFFGSHKSSYGLNGTKGGCAFPEITDETRRKMSESRRGDKNPLFGKTHSKEAKDKISKAHKGRKAHPNTIAAGKAATTGRVKTKEEIEKIRASKLGKKRPASVCKRISEVRKSPMVLVKDCSIMEFESMESVEKFLKSDRKSIRQASLAERNFKGYNIYYL